MTYALRRPAIGQAQPIGSVSPPAWVDVADCDSTKTDCTDMASTGAMYTYRVRAKNDSTSNPPTPWSYVAVFLSEGNSLPGGDNDGYVQKVGTTKTEIPNAAEPRICAGRGGAGVEFRGFLSFDTSALAGAKVLAAKLRLYQTTNNDGYDALGSTP